MPTLTQVDIVTALKWVTAWRSHPDVPCNNFIASQIPLEDTIGIQSETGAVALRAYNGYDADNNLFKLLLVGIDNAGNDLIDVLSVNSQIYDLTLPCPDTCCYTSPLYTGQAVEQE